MKFTPNENIQRNAACASTLKIYIMHIEKMTCFGAMSISHDLIHLDIFYSLTTTAKSVHGKHPYVFSKFNKHLIVEFGMCENTCIRVWSFSGSSTQIQPLAHMPCCLSWSFYPKTVEITCPKRNAYELMYRS